MKSKLMNLNNLSFWQRFQMLFINYRNPSKQPFDKTDIENATPATNNLPYYLNAHGGMSFWEPFYANLFTVEILHNEDTINLNWLQDQIVDIVFDIDNMKQLTINFNENVNDANELVSLPTLLELKNLPETDTINIVVKCYTRKGDIFIQYNFNGVKIENLNQSQYFRYSDAGIMNIYAEFSCKTSEILCLKNKETKVFPMVV